MNVRRRWARAFASLAIGAASFVARGAHAEPVRLLVSVGHKAGLAAERPLKFADTDAARVRDVLVSMGGVEPKNAVVLLEPSAPELFGALDRLKAEAQKRKPEDVTLIFYFSGHGDREAIHLGDSRVSISDLSSRLGQIPAALRIVVTDACRATRDKGMTAESAFPISLGQLPQASGSVWINAASDGEAAQESDELQGAIFTHSWLNGLRGAADANGDARVTLDESFAFAHSQTLLRSAKSSGVLQKPEAVVTLKETAPVVLTQTAARLATVSLPPARDTHYLVYAAGAKSVIASIWGSGDRRTALAVPPGRYIVHRRMAGAGGIAQIAIGQGEERALEGPDFTSASLEALARKGELSDQEPDQVAAAPALRHHELSAGFAAGTSASSGFVQAPNVRYAYSFGRWALAVGGALEMANADGAVSSEKTLTPVGTIAVEPRWTFGRTMLRIGGGLRAGAIVQTMTRKDASEIGRADYPAESKNTAFVWGPEIYVALRLLSAKSETVAGLFVDLEGRGNLSLFQRADSLEVVPAFFAGISAGLRF